MGWLQRIKAALSEWRKRRQLDREARRLHKEGYEFYMRFSMREAFHRYAQALEIAYEIANPELVAKSFGGMSEVCRVEGQTERALEYAGKALEAVQRTKNRRLEALIHVSLATVYEKQGRSEQASDHMERALAIARAVRDPMFEGNLLFIAGNHYAELGRSREARQYYQRAVAILTSASRGLVPTASILDTTEERLRETLAQIESRINDLPDLSESAAAPVKQAPGSDATLAVSDRVHFSITSPRMVSAGAPFVVDVWAHLEEQRETVLRRAQEATGPGVAIRSKGPVKVARGTVLSVRLKVDTLIVEDPTDTILWDGEAGNATFLVMVPQNVPEGPRSGLATIHVNGLRIAKIDFVIQVGKSVEPVGCLEAREERHRKAFASYASADLYQVLARIQGIQKGAPDLEVFLDVISLRSGQDWAQELWKVIPASDVFYLFWSANAKGSTWVEKEWRCAYDTRGLEFIDPVPLVSPREVPPPSELASKHFNDWVLGFMTRADGK